MRGLVPATEYDKVYNDECVLSFDSPFSPGGLYVSLRTYLGFGAQHVQAASMRSGETLYVHLQKRRTLRPKSDAPDAAPTKMALGVEGGFSVDGPQYDESTEAALVLMPSGERVPLPCQELPEFVSTCCQAIVTHVGAMQQRKESAVAWEAETLPSKYAEELVQLPPHKKISPDPAAWVCEESGMRENLWLNLSDGHIGSGRRQWDGSGGTNGALNHYEETKKHFPPHGFPLVVKLGTITPHGADVYSYADDENSEVTDPKLAEHLAHWGIDVMRMEKTAQSVTEMNIAANESLELDKITEAGKDLAPLTSRGYLGLNNLGNSCYVNSVLQLLFTLPEYQTLHPAAPAIFATAPSDPTGDLPSQLAKLGGALLGDRYNPGGDGAPPPPPVPEGGEEGPAPEAAVAPRMLISLVGKGHSEFSSSRQQDAAEYLAHLVEAIGRAERARGGRLGDGVAALGELSSFALEERVEAAGQVAYKRVPGSALSLQIPLELASNAAEVAAHEAKEDKRQKLDPAAAPPPDDPVVPLVSFEACLSRYLAVETLENFRGHAGAAKTTRFATFPRVLVVQLSRYYTDADWTAKKMAVAVPVPETLSLEAFRGGGLQPGESPLPDEPNEPAPAPAPARSARRGGATRPAAARRRGRPRGRESPARAPPPPSSWPSSRRRCSSGRAARRARAGRWRSGSSWRRRRGRGSSRASRRRGSERGTPRKRRAARRGRRAEAPPPGRAFAACPPWPRAPQPPRRWRRARAGSGARARCPALACRQPARRPRPAPRAQRRRAPPAPRRRRPAGRRARARRGRSPRRGARGTRRRPAGARRRTRCAPCRRGR
uniref:Uncharacterized protein n=1 Tax=Emiliania huxleyi TaxID=2903 RepID=A0A6V2MYT4_EMIHU